MIDFTLALDDFARSCKMMTRSRTKAPAEVVDLLCAAGTVKFIVVGRDSTCAAEVAATGKARLPMATLEKLAKDARSFGSNLLRIRIEEGRIRLNSMSISNPSITVSSISDRPIDIPDDATIRDILALQYLFTPEELSASDLKARFTDARKAEINSVNSATASLAPLGVPGEVIQRLVLEALQSHARTLQPMLKPKLISERIN